MPLPRPSRRALLRSAGAGVAGLACIGLGSAEQSQPDRSEWDEILDEMAGDGTDENPYVVTDVRELQALSGDPTHCRLENDIDASASADWDDGHGFEPMQIPTRFDGDGHAIHGLTIDRPEYNAAGLFNLGAGNLQNIHLLDVSVTASDGVGGLVGDITHGTVADCSASGTVNGEVDVGGLIGGIATGQWPYGTRSPPRILDCRADCVVDGESRIGGLVGTVEDRSDSPAILRRSSATGSVTGERLVGGLVGRVESRHDRNRTEIRKSTAVADVTARCGDNEYVGGLCGRLGTALVSDSRAAARVQGRTGENVGGLAGQIEGTDIARCYAAGAVHGGEYVGGLIGEQVGNSTNEAASMATVRGDSTVGGICGNLFGNLSNAVALGHIHGRSEIGGIVGSDGAWGHAEMHRTLALGPVTGASGGGGIVGSHFDGEVTLSYWDVERTGQGTSTGSPHSHGVPSAELRGEDALGTLQLFDFQDIWRTVPGDYPRLRNVASTYSLRNPDIPSAMEPGGEVSITVTIQNVGEQIGRDPVRVRIDDQFVASATIGRLEPSAETTVTLESVEVPQGVEHGDVRVLIGYDELSDSVSVVNATGGDEAASGEPTSRDCEYLDDTAQDDDATDSSEDGATNATEDGGPNTSDDGASDATDEEPENETDDSGGSGDGGDGTPGFGLGSAIAAIGGGLVVLRRRIRDTGPEG